MEESLARSLWVLPAVAYLFSFYPSTRYEATSPPGETKDVNLTYDFIVVGGGTAGSIIANRLSEDVTQSVLLLEAGGQETYEVQVPALAPYLQLSELDWRYQAAPSSTSCLAMKENRCNLPRGKVLGGSSSINFLLYVRGNKRDYDLWESLGNLGWSYKDVLHYFKKSEDNKAFTENNDFHAVGGYQPIEQAKWKTPLAAAFLEAGRELGYPTVDVNGKDQVGFMLPQGFNFKGARFSSSRSFLSQIRKRANLHIKTEALVTKILFGKENKAESVVFERGSRNFSVSAKKEIILTAGAFGTPHLLMLSGIGPASQLRRFGIRPLLNLPVGRNMQDHVAGQQIFVVEKPVSLKRRRIESFASIFQYLVWGSGPIATFGGIEGIGFINTRYANASLGWPDIQFQFLSGSFASDRGQYLFHTSNLRDEYWDTYLKPLVDVDTFTVIAKLMRPRSRGYLELTSSNPREMPKIVTNFLTEPSDLIILSEGLKVARALGEARAFKRFGSKFYKKPFPGCEAFHLRSSKYWECYLRHLTLTIYHYCGTAKMGPYWDPEAVVDPQLRVYGISGLRVADASIFPTIPTGNTNAPVMMVAEKAADMIREYWQERTKDVTSKSVLDKEPPSNIDTAAESKGKFKFRFFSKRNAKEAHESVPRREKLFPGPNETEANNKGYMMGEGNLTRKSQLGLGKNGEGSIVRSKYPFEMARVNNTINGTKGFHLPVSKFNFSQLGTSQFFKVVRDLNKSRTQLLKDSISNKIEPSQILNGHSKEISKKLRLKSSSNPPKTIYEQFYLNQNITTNIYNNSTQGLSSHRTNTSESPLSSTLNWDTEHEDL